MKGFSLPLYLVFLFMSMLIILRPVIIFSSTAVQAALTTQAKAFGLVRSVRKRREKIPVQEIINEEPTQTVLNSFLPFILLLVKKWLRKIVVALSFFLSNFLFYLKRRRTVFELSPNNQQYLVLSVFRI